MARKRTVLGWAVGVLLAAVLFLVGLFLFLERTERGQGLVLDQVVELLEGAINAEITYEGVRSEELTRGATLFGVRVTGHDGRPFLVVDSLRTTYAWRTFLSGDVVLESLVLWGPELTISRYPGEEQFNADRIFQTDEDVPSPEAPARRILLRDVRLVDAFVEVLQPVDPEDPPPERMLTVTRPGVEGELHRFAFESIQAWMPEVWVASPEKLGPEVTLDSLSMLGHVYQDPFVLTQLRGEVAWGDGTLTILADEMGLPGTQAEGRVVADFAPDEGVWVVEMQLDASRYALDDLQWLLPDLPAGEGEGTFDIRFSDGGDLRFGFGDATLEMDGSRLAGSGTVLRDGEMTLRDVRVEASPLALARLEPFLDEPLPLDGTVQGRVALDGTLASLSAEGRLTLREPGHAPTTADFDGTFHLAEGRTGVTGLEASLDPLDYGLLATFFPASRLEGGGRARVTATGSLEQGLRFNAELDHVPDGLPASQVLAEGSIRAIGEDDYTLDVQADVSPLSLTALASYWPDIPVTGEVSGTLRALGPLSDLRVTTDLQTEAGDLALETRFDARDPGAYYLVEGEVSDFVLSRIVQELPDPTVFTGSVRIEGRGLEPATASLDAVLDARASRVGELDVADARARFRVREGVFHVDTLEALVGGVQLDARGTLAVREGGPAGEVRVAFASDSLARLRPLLMGRNIIARDTVESGLLRVQLEAAGIDPDTLPTLEEVTVAGRVRGEVTLSGSLERFSAVGTSSFEEVQYGTNLARGAEVTFSAEGLPGLEGDLHATVVADSLQLAGRAFEGGELAIDYARPQGAVDLLLERDGAEDYRARARFEVDSLGGRVELDELALRFDTLVWQLERPTVVTWDRETIGVSDLSLAQSGGEGVRITATGELPRAAEQADFTLDVEGLRLEEVGRLLQLEEMGAEGVLDLSLRVQGTADDPSVEGTLVATDVRYQEYGVDQVEGSIGYLDRRLALELHAREGELEVLHVTGTIPANLALRGVDVRFPDEEIDLEVVADSLPAAFVTSVLSDLAAVEGTVAGRFDIGGTLQNPSPSGRLVLQGAAATVVPIGVRHEDVVGTLDLRPDGTLEVDASASAGDGTARVTGTVRLEPLSNPTLDLEISLASFLAVDRRDVLATVSGIVTLTGTYQRPFIQGLLSQGRGLTVEAGVLFVEEFVRAATIVDLDDPRFRSQLDPELLEEDPIVRETPNPFMQNLRVDVDLAMEQASLRSDDMNVELGGDLKVTYSRSEQELVMLGDLRAIRGEYSVLGRRFQVRAGTVEFLGLPGVNPNLDITADARVRRPGDQDLTITAQVSGTLETPRVALSSDEVGVAPSDLASYLIFGRPTYELASGQQALAQNVTLAGAGVLGSVLSGTLAGRFSAEVTQRLGLDYFAITQVGNFPTASAFSQTQLEFGQYLTDDVFVGLALQPWGSTSGSSGNFINRFGLRLEWTPSEDYTLQTFWEDRFLRSRPLGFDETFGSTQKILGLFVFSEWGY